MKRFTKTYTRSEVVALLNTSSPKHEALFLALCELGQSSTAQIANVLGWDRSNTCSRLEALANQGRIVLVNEAFSDGAPGRPTRLWAVRFAQA
jgi:predicted ArsR family transcriptional regulator